MNKDKKLGSFNIRDMRESSKKSVREEPNKTKTSLLSEADKKRKTQPKFDSNYQLQKQFVRAENLSEEQQQKIRKDAERVVSRKAKSTEVKVENQMISILETQCNKIGQELETEKAQNHKLRFEITQLRKNINFLNNKLENVYRDHDSLSKNNDCGKMEKEQLKEEVQKARSAFQRSEDDREHHKKFYQSKVSALQVEVEELRIKNNSLQESIKNVRDEKDQFEEEFDEKCKQYDYVRDQFQERKREWDRLKQDMQAQTRGNLDRKGQKITKFQVQLQNLTDKLREEQAVRKKMADKNKQLERQIIKKGEVIRDMEDQITNMKKRINDLSILKSSNNTIMNQKLSQLSEENAKLKKNLEIMQTKKGVFIPEQQSKPFLFGPEDD